MQHDIPVGFAKGLVELMWQCKLLAKVLVTDCHQQHSGTVHQ